MDIFDLFDTSPYQFLVLSPEVEGNTVVDTHDAEGIVKLRSGMQVVSYGEVDGESFVQSAPTVHIRPTEPFLSVVDNDMIGHGIRVDGKDYRIVGQTPGLDYDAGVMMFYKVTLKPESIATWDASELPLS